MIFYLEFPQIKTGFLSLWWAKNLETKTELWDILLKLYLNQVEFE